MKRNIRINVVDNKSESGRGNGDGRPREEENDSDHPVENGLDGALDQAEPPVEPAPPPVDPVAELTDKLLRLAAEFENYKKRNSREFERGLELGKTAVIERVIPVMDALDSALSVVQADEKADGVYEGMKKIRQLLLNELTGSGMEIVEPAIGEAFDPNFHEVMLAQPTADASENTILAVFQRGYSLGGRLIRAAKVKIALAPQA